MGQKNNKCCHMIIPLVILGLLLSACGGGTLTPTPILPTPVSPTSIPSPMTPWPTWTPSPTWTPIVTIPCSINALISAIHSANTMPGTVDTIDLTPGCLYSITSPSGLPTITSPIVINGNGAIIQNGTGFGEFRIFLIENTGSLTLSDLTLTNGKVVIGPNESAIDGGGGAIYNSNILILNGVVFDENGATLGGALYNVGNAIITNSTFLSNLATLGDPNAQQLGGAIYNMGQISINNSTFTNNQALDDGGAIRNFGGMTIRNSTITGNGSDGLGSAIYNSGNLTMTYTTIMDNTGNFALHSENSSISIKNSIIANNNFGDCSYPLSSTILEENLSSKHDCFGFTIYAQVPGLDPLSYNGGQTFTHSLNLNSPAVDAATGYCPPTDQRGVTRPEGSACDLGAYELIGGGPTPEPTVMLSSVEGFIFNDINNNGIRDTNEVTAGVNGAHISLMEGICPGTNLISETWSTSLEGLYSFDTLSPGNYCILPDLSQQTLLPASHEITVGNDEHLIDLNFYLPDPGAQSSGSDRCQIFDNMNLSLILLPLPSETMVLPLYVDMNEKVPGLGITYPGDPDPWVYRAFLGSVESYRCGLQTGFEERLYCWLRIPPNLPGTSPEFSLYLDGCRLPIFYLSGIYIADPHQSGSACQNDLNYSECIAAGGSIKNKDTPQQTCDCP